MRFDEVNRNGISKEPFWNAHRLIKEYIGIAWMMDDFASFKSFPWDRQIRIRRVASVVCAFLNMDPKYDEPFDIISSVFSYIENRPVLKRSEITTSDLSRLKEMLCNIAAENWRLERLSKDFQIERDREELLKTFIRYRKATEDLETIFSGLLEARTGTYLGVNVIKNLYNPKIDECNEKIDDMIVILLGNLFQKTFTERELIEQYEYPSVTDEELLEWRINNN